MHAFPDHLSHKVITTLPCDHPTETDTSTLFASRQCRSSQQNDLNMTEQLLGHVMNSQYELFGL